MRTASMVPLFLAALVGVASGASAQLTITQQAKLPANAASNPIDFATSVAVSGLTAVAGAPAASTTVGGSSSGAAFVYVRDESTWTLEAELEATGSTSGDRVGAAVAVSGDTIVLGAPGWTSVPGAAYVFVRSGTTWTQQAVLVPDDLTPGGGFGQSVAISGNTIVVGAALHSEPGLPTAGMVYAFVRSGTTWTQQAKLMASDAAGGDQLGTSLALDGDTLLAGAPLDDNASGLNAGAGYVFVRSGATWTQQAKLAAPDGAANRQFSWRVALSGETAALSSQADMVSGQGFAGSVTIFVRSGSSWSPQAKLTAADAGFNENFGYSVALSGGAVAVGAPQDSDTEVSMGAAYLFVRGAAGQWKQAAKVVADDGVENDYFGGGIAFEGDTLIVGTPPEVGENGSAYVFHVAGDWDDLGFGLAGSAGIPALQGTGTLIAGGPMQLDLSQARASAPCALFVSLALNPTPFKGGTLAAVPPVLTLGLATSPAGTLPLAFVMPGGLPFETPIHFQYAILDPAAVAGVALSNLERGTSP